MVIEHNLVAMNAGRMLGLTNAKLTKSTEKLSSGYRVNRAADDAAGLAISEKMRRQVRGLERGARNIQEGVGLCQVADGALNEVHDMLHRMGELSVQAANDTCTPEDREYIDSEIRALRTECDRIFATTSFNERLIWKSNAEKLIGTYPTRAVKDVSVGGSWIDITNESYDKIPAGNISVIADETNGVKLSWRDYNGTSRETVWASWDDLKAKNYRFEMSDYFGGPTGTNTDLYSSSGQPLFTHQIAFSPASSATPADIKDSINGRSISVSVSASLSSSWEGAPGTRFSASAGINYPAEYASHKNSANGTNFNAADDAFFEPKVTGGTNLIRHPSYSTVDAAKTDSTGWTFEFDMEGIGTVKAVSSNISYSGSDRTPDDEGRWWNWVYYNGGASRYQSGITRSVTGDLKGLMSTLTGDTGILSKNPSSGESGFCDQGGNISISFNLTADSPYSYAGTTSRSVGSLTLSFSVSPTDTQQSILDRVRNALDDTATLDFSKSGPQTERFHIGELYTANRTIDAPIYGGHIDLAIQTGPETDAHFHIEYDSLGSIQLGIQDANVLTSQDAQEAIELFKNAEQIISEQRSVFGAYQNRLEHAYNVNKNSAENTQYAESRIRDTQMDSEIVSMSLQNILQQAGQSMLAQANQMNQSVLSLLQ